LLKRDVLQDFRALRCRSVSLWRSTNDVLIERLTFKIPNDSPPATIVPKTLRVAIGTIQPFSRAFSTTS
jgi:hypothetical protein